MQGVRQLASANRNLTMARIVRGNTHRDARSKASRIRKFRIGDAPVVKVQDLRDELADMRAVLLGEVDPPVMLGISTLYEVAEGYFSRACSIEQQILGMFNSPAIPNTPAIVALNKFRASELRSFKEMAKSAAELGSRRITAADLQHRQEIRGRESD